RRGAHAAHPRSAPLPPSMRNTMIDPSHGPAFRSLWRPLAFAAVALCGLVLAGVLGRWLLYRHTHLVAHRAVVRGVISPAGARLDGEVAQVLVRAGERVAAGTTIAKLEDSHLRARQSERSAELQEAQRELELAQLQVEHERTRLSVEAKRTDAQLRAAASDLN